jgi:hypothetical protein
MSLITHLIEAEPVAARRFARDWLRTHPGIGPVLPARMNEGEADARDRRHAQWAREVLDRMGRAVAGTAAEANLLGRGLTEPYPGGLIGHLPNARLGECALVGILTDEAGAPVGVQLGYLTPDGRKSVQPPQRNIFYIEADRERRRAGLFRVAATTPANDEDEGLDGAVLVCEGLEKVLAVRMAFPHAAVLGMPGIGRLRHLPPIKGNVIVVRDGDASDSSATRSLIKGVDHLLLSGATVRFTNTPAGEDADSIVKTRGIEALRELIRAASKASLSPDGEVQRLATMRVIDYERERAEAAKRIGIRKSKLDTVVTTKRKALGEDAEEDADALALGPEPWETPITDIGAVLSEASAELGKYVVALPEMRDTAVLWALRSYFIHHAFIQLEVSPRLSIKSVSPICGKTTLLELLGHLVFHPLASASLTPALVYRVMDALQPTLMLDEIDHALRKTANPELLAILRASHRRRTAYVARLVPTREGDWKPQMFSAWCTYAYTATERIEEALQSRAITLMLLRAKRDDLAKLYKLKDGTSEVLLNCGRKFARWAKDQVTLPDAEVPDNIAYRDHDNWRPLFRIAALAGDEWHRRAICAAQVVNGSTVAVGAIVPLLNDIREVFGTRERMTTDQLVAGLLTLPEPSGDWAVIKRGRPIDAYYLRDHLRDLVNPPEKERRWNDKSGCGRGYRRRHFDDAFARYLPPEDGSPDDQAVSSNSGPVGDQTSVASVIVTKTRPFSGPYDEEHVTDGPKANPEVTDADPADVPVRPENEQPEPEKLHFTPPPDSDAETEEWPLDPTP